MNKTLERFLLGLVITSGLTALVFIFMAAGFMATYGVFTVLGAVDMHTILMWLSIVTGSIAGAFLLGVLIHNVGLSFEECTIDNYMEGE